MTVKNLVYHITPLANWRWNLQQLLPHLPLFDGKKIFSIAWGPKPLETVKEVTKLLPKDVEIITYPNDIQLRETATLPLLLKAISKEKGVTFYAHTKGVTHGDNPTIQAWTDALYFHNLNRHKEVAELLKKYPIVGSLRRPGFFPHFPKNSHWHYSGTFFWFRNKDLFERKWDTVTPIKYGAEGYPGQIFKIEESGCLFGEGCGDMYNATRSKRVLSQFSKDKWLKNQSK